MADENDRLHDRPELLPESTNAADPEEAKRRELAQRDKQRARQRYLKRVLAHPEGRELLWSILEAAGTFEERYGFGPNGFPNPEASWSYRGQKDLGLRLYHSWSLADRAGVLAMLDEFHPLFPKSR